MKIYNNPTEPYGDKPEEGSEAEKYLSEMQKIVKNGHWHEFHSDTNNSLGLYGIGVYYRNILGYEIFFLYDNHSESIRNFHKMLKNCFPQN